MALCSPRPPCLFTNVKLNFSAAAWPQSSLCLSLFPPFCMLSLPCSSWFRYIYLRLESLNRFWLVLMVLAVLRMAISAAMPVLLLLCRTSYRGPHPSGDDLECKSCLKATVYVSLCHFTKQICPNSSLVYGCTVWANGWIGGDQVDEKSH